MWGQVAAESDFRVMDYDVPSGTLWELGKNTFFVSIRGDSAEEITAIWRKLSSGATVAQPLAPSGWAPLCGMLTNGFGITWVLDVATEHIVP